MSKKICIVDYIGNSNCNGVPVGHPIKILNEYIEMLAKDTDLSLVIPRNYKEYVYVNLSIEYLNYNIDMTEKNVFGKLKNVFKKLKNINKSLIKNNCDVVWFLNIDFVLGLSMLLNPTLFKKCTEIWITTYLDEFCIGSGIKNFIKNFLFKKVIKRSNYIFSSNKNLRFNNKNVINIPDYSYNKSIYVKYKNVKKIDRVVCVGTMNEGKDLEGMVDFFNSTNIDLKIIGIFYDKDLYIKLINEANNNIYIEDKILNNDEYYKVIAESKFLIIPYKEQFYKNRTSGVLQEAMFLNTIPVAPKFLLDFNDIDGVGYENLDDLKSFFKDELYKDVRQSYIDFDDINNPYNKENIKAKILRILNQHI